MSEAGAAVAHQFEDLDQQHDAVTLGMWIFLVTEVMFFGGLFNGYALYRWWYPAGFAEGSRLCEVTLGAMNTAVLLASSFTMALAVRSASLGARRLTLLCLVATMILGAAFLGIKFMEYFDKYREHLVPGFNFDHASAHAQQVELFICFYFAMTGLHALHMIIGIGLLLVMTWLVWHRRITPDHYAPVEVAGLYWHFVDIIWIFLFPLLYLVDLHR
jgi:cytochrome c oxidase subunit 3